MFDRIHQWTYPDLALPTWLYLSRNGSPHIGYQICGHTVVHSTLLLSFQGLCACVLNRSVVSVQLFVTPWTVAHQAPLCMEFSQARILEWFAISSYRGGLPDLGIEFMSSTLAGGFFTTEFFTTWKALSVSRTL